MPPFRFLFYLVSASTVALSILAIAGHLVPLSALVGMLLVQVLIVGSGVSFLRCEMFLDVLWHGPKGAVGVALTFDDGPNPEHTPKILDLLAACGVHATFFVVGAKAEKWPELVRAIVARGHAVGVHSNDHDRFLSLRPPSRVVADLARAIAVVESVSGVTPTLFRPPVGLSSARMTPAIAALGLTVVGWSVRGFDGCRGARPERVARRIVRGLCDGAIVLLHDSAERDDYRPASLDALPTILRAMGDRSLPGVRVDAWVRDPASLRRRRWWSFPVRGAR